MIKVRPVVVLARNRRARQLVTVVPLSTAGPDPVEPHHHRLSVNPIPGRTEIVCWAKCDMVATVGLARLDRVKIGRRLFDTPVLAAADFLAVKQATALALGLAQVAAGNLA